MNLLQRIFFGNTLLEYLAVIAGILLTWILLRLTRRRLLLVLKRLTSKSNTNIDDLLVEIVERFVLPYAYLLVNYLIIVSLLIPAAIGRMLFAAFLFVTLYFSVRLVNFFIQYSVVGYMERRNEPVERIKQVTGMLLVVKIVTWGIGLVVLADNLGYDVTTIIAGMGVGGIAIALAAQNILGDLFSYFVIFFDKPFEIGDFIIVSGNAGVVEKIGIKTSHIRSLDGQQLVMPNAEMVKSVIQNFKRLQKRRIVFSIGVIYGTSTHKLKKIPGIIQEIIDCELHAVFDRAHLKTLGDFSVNYEIVYYIESADYLLFMDTQQSICLRIFEAFEREQIEFAFPTQTLFINGKNGAIKNSIATHAAVGV
ncbi:MAG: mechanosensitive ion channel family protein [Ferruginibacter sp.]